MWVDVIGIESYYKPYMRNTFVIKRKIFAVF